MKEREPYIQYAFVRMAGMSEGETTLLLKYKIDTISSIQLFQKFAGKSLLYFIVYYVGSVQTRVGQLAAIPTSQGGLLYHFNPKLAPIVVGLIENLCNADYAHAQGLLEVFFEVGDKYIPDHRIASSHIWEQHQMNLGIGNYGVWKLDDIAPKFTQSFTDDLDDKWFDVLDDDEE